MTSQIKTNQKGFTLVELAIVLVIVGLLIGGILKGQELIGNAQLSSTVTQMRAIQAGVNGFRDQFNALAGDYNRGTTTIAQCPNVAMCGNGNGNSILNHVLGAAPVTNDEGAYFFGQLLGANLIGGFDGTANLTFGQGYPASSTTGGYIVGDTRAGAYTLFSNTKPGIWLIHNGSPAAVSNTSGALTPSQAARIDRRMDDGMPRIGDVVTNAGTACAAAGATSPWLETANVTCAIGFWLGQ